MFRRIAQRLWGAGSVRWDLDASGGKVTIVAKTHADGVARGTDSELDNPIARACRNLLATGQRFTSLTNAYFCEPCGSLRWFGVFVETAGGRVLYFPGFARAFDHIVGERANRSVGFRRPLPVDHLTLEKDLASWHITSARSKHQRISQTLSDGTGSVLWFGMTIARANVLRVVSAQTVVSVRVPSVDALGRAEVFVESKRGAQFPVITIDRASGADNAMHFAVVVGPADSPDYAGPVPVPPGSDCENHSVRGISFALGRRFRVQIISTWIVANIDSAVSFSAPSP